MTRKQVRLGQYQSKRRQTIDKQGSAGNILDHEDDILWCNALDEKMTDGAIKICQNAFQSGEPINHEARWSRVRNDLKLLKSCAIWADQSKSFMTRMHLRKWKHTGTTQPLSICSQFAMTKHYPRLSSHVCNCKNIHRARTGNCPWLH